MDDSKPYHEDPRPASPHEAAERDEAAAAQARHDQAAWQAVDQGLNEIGKTMEAIGAHDAATSTWHSAEDAARRSTVAGTEAADYESAAHHWRSAEHDLAEQTKLSGESLIAHSAAVEAADNTKSGPSTHGAAAAAAIDEIQSQTYAMQAAAAGMQAADEAKSATQAEEHAHWEESLYPKEE